MTHQFNIIFNLPHIITDMGIMSSLMHALFFANKDCYLDEVIELGEKILNKSVCDNERYGALNTLSYSYMRKGMTDEAKDYACKLPGTYCTSNNVLESILKGEECLKLTQENIRTAVCSIDTSVTWMLRSKEYTPEQRIFFYDDNFGFEYSGLYMLWINIAKEYARLKNVEKTIEALKKAYTCACTMDNFKEGNYSSIFFDSMKYSKEGFSRNFRHTYLEWLKSAMDDKEYDFIRDMESFKRIME